MKILVAIISNDAVAFCWFTLCTSAEDEEKDELPHSILNRGFWVTFQGFSFAHDRYVQASKQEGNTLCKSFKKYQQLLNQLAKNYI